MIAITFKKHAMHSTPKAVFEKHTMRSRVSRLSHQSLKISGSCQRLRHAMLSIPEAVFQKAYHAQQGEQAQPSVEVVGD